VQEHADVARRHALDHREDGLHRRARRPARLRAIRLFFEARAEPRHFGAQRFALQRVANRRLERRLAHAVGIARLQHVVGRAEADGFDDRRRRAPARQHDDLRVRPCLANRAQRLQAVEPRHQHVEQDDLGRRSRAKGLEQRRPGRVGVHRVAARGEQRLQILGKRRIVVDDGEARAHDGWDSSGNAMVTAPDVGTVTLPPTIVMRRQASGSVRP
jgi:hypothetical protein